jgi:tripeptidyl-peptidase-1
MVSPNRTVRDPESAVWESFPYPFNGTNNAYTSGGGFSNTFSAPNYQTSTVDGYFQHHNPPYPSYVYNGSASSVGANGGIFNRAGRGVPDVAANGLNIPVVVNGHFSLSGGTSASAPIFASIINRINEERLAIGKKTVGFINPVLYQFPWILNDITNGTNPNCNTEGFEAVAGWDPVTGLGTPNYPKMVELFLALP